MSSKAVLGGSVKGQELERLRQAVARLMDAHQEALDAARGGIEFGSEYSTDEAQLQDTSEHLEAALVDVLNILEGAFEDVRGILGEADEERGGGGAA